MKNLLFISILSISCLASASSSLDCRLASDACAWLNPAPGQPAFLGYCIDRVEGNDTVVSVGRINKSGEPLASFKLLVTVLSEDSIVAESEDKMISLNLSKYGDMLAGGLLVKSLENKAGLGFYISCNHREALTFPDDNSQ